MPERATAALTSSAEATMMTMSSLKPVNASSAGTMPTTTAAKQREHRHEVVAQPAPDRAVACAAVAECLSRSTPPAWVLFPPSAAI